MRRGGNQTDAIERYFPVAPAATFPALVAAAGALFKVKSTDDFTLAVTFSSGASAFTWGENFTAQVVPEGEGSTVRVTAVGKVGGQLQQSRRSHSLMDELFTSMTKRLRPPA